MGGVWIQEATQQVGDSTGIGSAEGFECLSFPGKISYRIGESRVRHSRLSLRRRREIALSIINIPEHLFHCLTLTLRLPYAQPTRLKVLQIIPQILHFYGTARLLQGKMSLVWAALSHLLGQVILDTQLADLV